jgi:enoyl-CoA hydratase/carnithine racemase
MATLFSVPIPPLGDHPGGAIVATEPAPAVYLLTITSPPDNRLTTPSCTAMLDALDLLEFGGYKPGVVVTTSGIDKFYSNGLDLEHAMGTEGFLPGVLFKLFARFLTYVFSFFGGGGSERSGLMLTWHETNRYPMPTIALLPGHAFAGGLMLASK